MGSAIFAASAILALAAASPVASACAVDAKIGRREAAAELIYAYSRAFDEHRFGDYADLFTEDAEWWGGRSVVRGRIAIRQAVEKTFGAVLAGHDFHTNSNIHVEGSVEGSAYGSAARTNVFSRWIFWTKGANGKPEVMVAGHYEDVLVREKGCWLFAKRVIISDIPFSDPRGAGE